MVATSRGLLSLGFGILLFLGACTPSPATPQPTLAATATPSVVPPTPTPTLNAVLHGPQLNEGPEGRIEALGLLEHRGPQPIEKVTLEFTFLDAEDHIIAQEDGAVSLPWLPPGGVSPIHATFAGGGEPRRVRAAVLTYQPGEFVHAEVEAQIIAEYSAPSGIRRVLGTLRSSGSSSVHLQALALTAQESGRPVAVAEPIDFPQWIPADDPVPFEGHLPVAGEAEAFRVYPLAVPRQDRQPPQLQVDLTPGLTLDDQDNPFFAGVLHNPTEDPVTARAFVSVRSGDSLLRVLRSTSPIPVEPGEIRPFGGRIPDLPASAEPTELSLAAWADDGPAHSDRPRTLRAQIDSVEAIGGALFLRGIVRNAGGRPVAAPTIFASLRSTAGELWSAAWLPLGDGLQPEQEADFVLTLPLPAEARLPNAEFDLRALGLHQGSAR